MTREFPPLPDLERVRSVFRYDRGGLDTLLALTATDRVSEHETPRGPVVVIEGRKQHSGRDPQREAVRFVRDLDISEATALMLYGYGSGYVARALRKKSDAHLFIYEPDLEALRWGLTHGDIPDGVTFLSSVVAVKTIMYAALTAGDRGQLIPWQPSVRLDVAQYQEVKEELEIAVHRAKVRALTAEVRGDGWLNFFLKNVHNITRAPASGAFSGAFAGVPAVVCSAGPSLNKQLEQLREIQDQVIILSVNTALGALHQAGICPHAVVAVESANLEIMFEKVDYLPQLNAMLDLTCHPRQFEIPFRKVIPFSTENTKCSQVLYELEPNNTLSGGFCVANTAFSLAVKMGCNPIMLIGQDLAYSNGQIYAKGTVFESIRTERRGNKLHLIDEDGAKDRILATSRDAMNVTPSKSHVAEHTVVPGWGNVGDVESTADFMMFRDWFARSASRLRERGLTCVNATEGGLTIPEWDEISFAEAIERYVTPRPSGEVPLRQRFNDLADQPGTETGRLLAVVARERAYVQRLREMSARAQVLVNFDPDGDLNAPEAAQLELAEIQQELAHIMERAPLASDALSRPFENLHQRQEMNLFAIHRAIDETLEPLQEDLLTLETRIRAEGAADPAS